MSKRFSITLSDGEYEDLKRLVKEDGAELATRAAFFVQRGIDQYRQRKDFSISQLINFVRNLLGKKDCPPAALPDLEKIVGVREEELSALSTSLENLEMLTGALRSLVKARDFDGYSIAELSELLGCECRELDEFVDGLSGEQKENNKRGAKT